jgi:hypothetical protein
MNRALFKIIPPGGVSIQKPDYDEPCNGCGYCCSESLCFAAMGVLGREPNYIDEDAGPCPFLRYVDAKFRCGLVLLEQESGLEPIISKSLGIGVGCQSCI